MQLDQLLAARADLWRGRATPQATPAGLSTGFRALDAALSGHGWPAAALSEVLSAHQGAGLALLLPLLAALSNGGQHRDGGQAQHWTQARAQPRWLLWVDPPHIPFAPALAARGLDLRRILIVHAGAEAAWAAEQGLRSGTCAAVLAWTGPGSDRPERSGRDRLRAQTGAPTGERRATGWTPAALRRLQLAAAETETPALLLRPLAAAGETSPAALRLKVSACAEGLDLTLLKQRGGRPGQRLRLPARPDAERLGASHPDSDNRSATTAPKATPAVEPAPLPASASSPIGPPEHPPAALRQVQAAGGGVLPAAVARRNRRRRSMPRR
jgi:hypothetical protein